MSLRIALALALLAGCREREAASPSPPTPGDARAAQQVGIGPALPTIDAAPAFDGPPPEHAELADEPRDPAWAAATESDLRARLADLSGVAKVEVECRTSRCKVAVIADAGAATAAAGEVEAALRGHARQLILSGVDPIVIYVVFAR